MSCMEMTVPMHSLTFLMMENVYMADVLLPKLLHRPNLWAMEGNEYNPVNRLVIMRYKNYCLIF